MAKLRIFEHLKGLARVSVFTTSVFVGLGLLAARTARSHAGEASVVIGREFAGLGDLVRQGYRVRLNGEALHVGSTTVNVPTDEVLNRFEALCRQGSRGLDDVVTNPDVHLDAAAKADLKALGLNGLGIIRNEMMDEGTIACIAHPDGSFRGLTDRLMAFSKSMDLKDLGGLRYIYTRSTSDRSRSQVITVWTNNSLRIDRVFVADGDAPGSDPVGMPRPPKSVRRLTAEVEGAPYGVRLYESDEALEQVLAFYDENAPKQGWESHEVVTKVDATSRVFSRADSDLMLFVAPGRRGVKTSVSMVELPAKSQPSGQ